MDQDLAGVPTVEVSSLDSDFQTFAVSNQAQMKELIQWHKFSVSFDIALFAAVLVLIFMSSVSQMRT